MRLSLWRKWTPRTYSLSGFSKAAVVLAAITFLLAHGVVRAESDEYKVSLASDLNRVLIINSYHEQHPKTKAVNEGLTKTLWTSVANENIHVESLDALRFADDHTLLRRFAELLAHKYQHAMFRPRIILLTGDAALELALMYMPWASGIPKIFVGVNSYSTLDLNKHPMITGIYEGHSIEENMHLIKRVRPQTKHLIVLAGADKLPSFLAKETKHRLVDGRFAGMSVTVKENYMFDELFNDIRRLPENSAIFVLGSYRDCEGEYLAYETFFTELIKARDFPIFGMSANEMLGKGVLGGYMNDAYQGGVYAAKMANRVFSGVHVSDIPVLETNTYRAMFDHRQIQQFDIDPSLLPKNAEIRFKPKSFYEENKLAVRITAGVLALLMFVNVALSLNISRRMEAEKKVNELLFNMEGLVEKRTEELEHKNQELRAISKEMERLANSDVLTGMHNRRYFQTKAESFYERFKFEPNSLSIAVVDIDFFKSVNDQYGHQVGDKVLAQVANLLSENIRPQDVAARWGGEEFVILFPETSQDEAREICERIRCKVEEADFPWIRNIGRISVSIGVDSNQDADTIETFLYRVDDFLYAAKENGRNQVVSEYLS